MMRNRTLVLALVGSLLMWAAQPPLALGWLGWIAPMPWLVLVRQETLMGRRPYGTLWFAAFVFWMAALHWLRLPHPAVYLGWFALSAYLAVYLPLFVSLSRVAVHQLKLPLWLAAPVVWTGLELARAHVMTGFMMGSLAHTQAKWPIVIQISSLAGEYGVDFVMILVAACITCFVLPPRREFSLVPALIVVPLVCWYGGIQLSDESVFTHPPVRIALIQGNSLADWKSDVAKQQQIMSEYYALSKEAVAKAAALDGRPIDLVVWPETMFRSPLRSFEPGYKLPSDVEFTTEEIAASGPRDLAKLTTELNTPVLVGVDRLEFLANGATSIETTNFNVYNSSVLVDRNGKLLGTYDKFHLVMFGEYVPFSRWLPFLKGLSSLTGAAEAGIGPVALELDGVYYAPSICYETVIPHVIRHQVATLDAAGERPDVLVNLTNDAWYWGSSELDMHLACDVFRAVETRTPLVIAANGGISAWINRHGQIRAQSPRQTQDVILADVELCRTTAPTVYVRTGDWFAATCLTCCVVLAIIGWRSRDQLKPQPSLTGLQDRER
jgi:apolipoprotein N-acyltransferase